MKYLGIIIFCFLIATVMNSCINFVGLAKKPIEARAGVMAGLE